MISSVTVSHPHGNPNSHHAARAFSEIQCLRSFESGLVRGAFPLNLMTMFSRQHGGSGDRSSGLPRELHNQHLVWETTSQIGKKVRPSGLTNRVTWYDVLFCGHDWQVSNSTGWDIGAVYAYEDGSQLTFRAAKKKDVRTVYELPAGYYKGVRNDLALANVDTCTEPAWKMRRKDEELRLADIVVVASQWASETLKYANLGSRPVIKIPYGMPVDETLERQHPPNGSFTVLFAGQIGARKGVLYLLEAWHRLNLKNAQLLLAGSISPTYERVSAHLKSCRYVGVLPRGELLRMMKEADLFVLPSLADGFGLVIGEAMAVGVPVLTTTNTGGPELITNGQEGWCVPAHDVDALAEKLEWGYHHRDELYEMGRMARIRAEQWTWADYRRKLSCHRTSTDSDC